MGAITQMTLFDLKLGDSSDDEVWDNRSEDCASRTVSPRLDHAGVTPPPTPRVASHIASSPTSPPKSSRDSAQEEAGASVANEFEPITSGEGGVSSHDEASARTEASAVDFEKHFGVCAPNMLTVRGEVWRTMLHTSTKMDENGAFKAVVKAGLGPSMQSNSMVDPMIDGMMCDLLKVDKIGIEILFQIVGEIPDYMRTGIETGDFPSTSTEELIAQVKNLSDLFQRLSEACTAAYLEVPPDDYKQSAAECIKDCLRMLKLLSAFRVHDGMS